MSEVLICKETAEESVKQFGRAWGLYDAKAVISAGKESSIPQEVRDLLLANVMTGDVEFAKDGKEVIVNLSDPVGDTKKATFARKLRAHDLREIQEMDEIDQIKGITQLCTGLSDLEMSELTNRDTSVLTAVAVYVSFS